MKVARLALGPPPGLTRLLGLLLASLLAISPGEVRGQQTVSLRSIPVLTPTEIVSEFGSVEGLDGIAFTRVFDARLVGDSAVLVTDARRPSILLLDPDDLGHREIGRGGEGPGEFTGTPYIGPVRSERIPAWDPGSARISWFDMNGELLDEVTLDPKLMTRLPNSRTVRAWQVDDGLILSASGRQSRDGEGFITTLRPMVVNPTTGAVAGVGSPMVNRPRNDGGIFVEDPWSPFGVLTLHDGRVVIADPSAWELRLHNEEGDLVRTLRSDFTNTSVDDDLVERVHSTFEGYYGGSAKMMRLFGEIDPPQRLPAIGELRSSSDGRLLVSRFRPLDTGAPLAVDVLDSDLTPTARVVLGEEYQRILDLNGDLVLALTRGEFGVSVLRILRLEKTSSER